MQRTQARMRPAYQCPLCKLSGPCNSWPSFFLSGPI